MRHLYVGSLVVAVAFAAVTAACVQRVERVSDGEAADQGSGADEGTGYDGGPVAEPSASSTSKKTTSGADAGATGADVPCDVQSLLQTKCVSCHASPPINGSLSPLVTAADLQAKAKEDATKNEAELSISKMQAGTMPPGGGATPAEIAALQSWMKAGYTGTCAPKGGADGGAATPTAVDPFAGASPYVARTASRTHNAGKNCMGGCHDHGFTFAGTLRDANGNGIAAAEVRLVDANGKAILVNTDSSGNFHSSQSWSGPAHVGARTSTDKAIMVTALQPANGGCNGCHASGGTVSPIHLP